MNKPMKSDIDIVKDIIDKSGNGFHCKVLKALKEKGWTVQISPYYNNNASNKPREIDLVAERAFPFNQGTGKFSGYISARLFIECKYVSQKTVFWFHIKDMVKSNDMVAKQFNLRENNRFTSEHHYLKYEQVAKLFSDEGKKASENELFYKALNQSLNAMVYYRNRGSILQADKREYVKKTLNFPVIICNSFDSLYRVDIDSDDDPKSIDDNFQLEVNYAYIDQNGKNRDEFFLLDVVKYDLLRQFLEDIEKDKHIFSLIIQDG